jgi:hypothetical protein
VDTILCIRTVENIEQYSIFLRTERNKDSYKLLLRIKIGAGCQWLKLGKQRSGGSRFKGNPGK